MKDFEKQYLNYKPILGYRPDVDWIKTSTGQDISENILPSEIRDANSILASDILKGALAAKDAAEALIGQLEQCLDAKKLNGPCQFSDYQKALTQKDSDTIAAFDDFHRSDIEGSVQAEMYPALLYVQDELESYTKRLGDTFFGQPDIKPSDIDRLAEEENKALNMRVVDAVNDPSRLDKENLAIEAKMKLQAKQRVEGLQKFVTNSVKVLSSTTSDRFNGKIEDAVKIMASAPKGNLGHLQEMSKVRAGTLGSESNSIHTRLKGVGNNQLRDKLDGTVTKLKTLHLDNGRKLTKWLTDVVEQDPQQNMFELVECGLSSMEEVNYALNNTILEAMKMNKLDELNRSDLLANVASKKVTRQIYNLAKNIEQHMDLEDPNRERQVKRFIENMGLKKPGDVCSD